MATDARGEAPKYTALLVRVCCTITVSYTHLINYQQMADFYDTNDAHQKLGRRIAETLLWEVCLLYTSNRCRG